MLRIEIEDFVRENVLEETTEEELQCIADRIYCIFQSQDEICMWRKDYATKTGNAKRSSSIRKNLLGQGTS